MSAHAHLWHVLNIAGKFYQHATKYGCCQNAQGPLETHGPGGSERSTTVYRLIGKLLLLHGSYRLLIGEHRRAVFCSIPSSSPYVPLPSSLFPLLSLVSGCVPLALVVLFTQTVFSTRPSGLRSFRPSPPASTPSAPALRPPFTAFQHVRLHHASHLPCHWLRLGLRCPSSPQEDMQAALPDFPGFVGFNDCS